MIRAPIWHPSRQVSCLHIPDVFRNWLLDTVSLTYRLTQACQGSFQVRVLCQAWNRARQDETRILKSRQQQVALIREVQLLCNLQPCVFARTVIPVNTISGKQRQLSNLGSRPLGAYLFADPTMRRGPVEISCIRPGHDLYLHALLGLKRPPTEIWGRRCVFYLGGKPLLVSEIFLDPPGKLLRRRPYT